MAKDNFLLKLEKSLTQLHLCWETRKIKTPAFWSCQGMNNEPASAPWAYLSQETEDLQLLVQWDHLEKPHGLDSLSSEEADLRKQEGGDKKKGSDGVK